MSNKMSNMHIRAGRLLRLFLVSSPFRGITGSCTGGNKDRCYDRWPEEAAAG